MTRAATVTEASCPLCGGASLTALAPPRHFVGGDLFEDLRGQLGVARCGDCRFVFSNPRPARARLEAYYDGIIYPRSLAGSSPERATPPDSEDPRQRFILDWIAARSTGRSVLDYGCSDGVFLAVARAAGWEACGYDIGAALDGCRRAGLPVVGDLAEVAPGSLDAVVLNQVFEHVEDRQGLLTRLRSLLRPSGRLFVQVPNAASLRARLAAPTLAARFELEERLTAFPIHLSFFTDETLRACVERAGFLVLAVDTFGFGSLRRGRDGELSGSPTPPRAAPTPTAPGSRVGSPLRRLVKRAIFGAHLGESLILAASPRLDR
jgi:SAM-dependent methyltransferase